MAFGSCSRAWLVGVGLLALDGCGRIWFEEVPLDLLDATADGPSPDGPLPDGQLPDAQSDASSDVILTGDSPSDVQQLDAPFDAGDSGVVTQPTSADTYIKGLDVTLHGSDIDVQVGRANGGPLIYGLVRFDLSSIPTNAIVISAKLRLYQYESNSSGTIAMGAHQVLQAWDEATATFNNASSGTPWTQGVGGTYNATAAATASVVIGTFGFYEWDLTALVQQWVSQSQANYGVELMGPSLNQGQWVGFASRENATTSERPQLVVTTQ